MIKAISWNVNGIRAVAKRGFTDFLMVHRPDILCLQETKAAPQQVPAEIRYIDGYHSYFCSAERKGYSGVALYSVSEPDSLAMGMGVPEFDSEGRIMEARFPDYGFTLLNVYFPNGGASEERLNYKLRFYDAFLDYMEGLRSQDSGIVLCGDVNTAHKPIDLARPKENEANTGFLPVERAWIDRVVGAGYVDVFRMFNDEPGHYTWWDMKTRARERNVGWRIDYFFVSNDIAHRVKSAAVMPEVMGSDHCPISMEILF